MYVLIDNEHHKYWSRATVTHSLFDVAHSFELATYGGKITSNSLISIFTEDETLLTTGFIDVFEETETADNFELLIIGRSKAQDFIDSSTSIDLKQQTLGNIIQILAKKHDITVDVRKDTPKINDFSAQAESPFNAVLEHVRSNNLVLYSHPAGNLILEDIGQQSGLILERGTFWDFQRSRVLNKRFYEYRIFSNNKAHAVVRDTAVRRSRLFATINTDAITAENCAQRAMFEAQKRGQLASIIRMKTVENVVLNSNVRVIHPLFDIDEYFVVSKITFEEDESNCCKTLELIRAPII